MEINAQTAKEILFEKGEINCTKEEYHRDVRNAIIDFKMRNVDLGKVDMADHCQKELDRLDGEFGEPPR